MTITDQQIRSFLARVGDAAPPAPEFDACNRAASSRPTSQHHRSPRMIASVVAGLLIVVGVGGLASVVRDSEPASESNAPPLPADPPGPLFVLPADLAAFSVSAGTVSVPEPNIDPPQGSYQWALLGTSVDGGFENLVGVMLMGSDARVDELLALGDWDQIETPTGPAHVMRSEGGGIGMVVQQRGTQWVRLTASDAEATGLVEMLSEIEISDTITISTTSTTRTAIARGTEVIAQTGVTVGFTASGPGGSFVIETATLRDPLAVLGPVGDRAERIEIGDRTGWLISQRTEHGLIPYSLIWSATEQRIIAVGTNSDLPTDVANLLRLAEQLKIVDETTWRAAIPDATTEFLTSS